MCGQRGGHGGAETPRGQDARRAAVSSRGGRGRPWSGTRAAPPSRSPAPARLARRTKAAPSRRRCWPAARSERLAGLVLRVFEAEGLLVFGKKDLQGPGASIAFQEEGGADGQVGAEERLLAPAGGVADQDDPHRLVGQGVVPQGGATEDQRAGGVPGHIRRVLAATTKCSMDRLVQDAGSDSALAGRLQRERCSEGNSSGLVRFCRTERACRCMLPSK